MLRTDKGFAMLAGLICAAHGIKAKDSGEVMTASDFDLWGHDDKPEEPEASIHELAAQLRGRKRG